MIPFHFDYYRPDTIKEAVSAYSELKNHGKSPFYYGGGSEIISMSRVGSIVPGAVIDIKHIPECAALEYTGSKLVIGSAVTLSAVSESKLFPLLGTAAGRIADHTNQCRITVGGNVCGTIIYRETVLPLLLTDSEVVITGPSGTKQVSIHDVFKERMKLRPGELIVSFTVDREYLKLKYVHVKKTKNEKIDYPLVSVAAFMFDGQLRMAFSGVCGFPFRSRDVERALNETGIGALKKAEAAVSLIPAPLLDNIDGSACYRSFVLTGTIKNALETLC
jgi:CO/xanthine dehydrogenase FAD-binding subunit